MEWTRGHVLGRGSTATVSAATSTSGECFAVKSVDFRHAVSLQKEQHFLSILKSPYVISYKGCDTTIEHDKMVYNIFLDYMCSGSITDTINRRNGNRLTEPEIARYTRQIVQGLEYIHMNGIVHCDIKGGNILLDENRAIAKISDFGCAKWANATSSPICGTPMYMSPETARGEAQGFPVDVWALGCTVIEMATGSPPWPDFNDPASVLYKIAFSNETPEIPDRISGVSDQAKDFVSKCLVRDPRHRWTAAELIKHPFIEIQTQTQTQIQIEEFDENLKQICCEKMTTDSPTSILDQDVWKSMKEGSSCSTTSFDGLLLLNENSLRQRIKQLAGKSEMPNWRCEKGEIKDWITIRD